MPRQLGSRQLPSCAAAPARDSCRGLPVSQLGVAKRRSWRTGSEGAALSWPPEGMLRSEPTNLFLYFFLDFGVSMQKNNFCPGKRCWQALFLQGMQMYGTRWLCERWWAGRGGQGAPALEFCPAEVGSCSAAAVGLGKGAVTCNWSDAWDKKPLSR